MLFSILTFQINRYWELLVGFLTLYTAMKAEQIGRSETLLSWTSVLLS